MMKQEANKMSFDHWWAEKMAKSKRMLLSPKKLAREAFEAGRKSESPGHEKGAKDNEAKKQVVCFTYAGKSER